MTTIVLALMTQTTRSLAMLKLILISTLASITIMTTIVLLLTWAPRMVIRTHGGDVAMSDAQTEHPAV